MTRDPLLFALIVVACAATSEVQALPRPDHVVVVIMENHSYGQIIGSAEAPNLNALAGEGAKFTNGPTDPIGATSGSHALRHPSQPLPGGREQVLFEAQQLPVHARPVLGVFQIR